MYRIIYIAVAHMLLACRPTTPPATVGSGTLETLLMEHDDLMRSAQIYTPEGFDSTFALPVVLNFHGFGGMALDHMTYTDMATTADEQSFLLVCPQGSLLDGYPHWNNALPGPDNKSDADDLGYLTKLIQALDDEYIIDRERIYACGFSNGGMMAYALACYLNNEIAAVACISGCLGDTSATCAPVHPTATLNIHGTQDGDIPYNGSSEVIGAQAATAFWADRNNTLSSPSVTMLQSSSYALEHIRYEAGDSNVVAEHYKVIGGDHRWFNFSVNGKNANLILWEFFDQFDIYGSR